MITGRRFNTAQTKVEDFAWKKIEPDRITPHIQYRAPPHPSRVSGIFEFATSQQSMCHNKGIQWPADRHDGCRYKAQRKGPTLHVTSPDEPSPTQCIHRLISSRDGKRETAERQLPQFISNSAEYFTGSVCEPSHYQSVSSNAGTSAGMTNGHVMSFEYCSKFFNCVSVQNSISTADFAHKMRNLKGHRQNHRQIELTVV